MDPTQAPPLAKYLVSTDKNTRDKAIKNLAAFLSDPSRDVLSDIELAKLWKGIFYCFWMSDKPLVQQELASELADILLHIASASSSLAFLRGFWEATVREWNGIDRLRMDKYLMLVRRITNASFRLLLRNEWELSICEQYNAILTRKGGPLCPDDMRVPTGLAYHLSDIYLEELNKVSQNCPTPIPLSIMLKPFFTLAAQTATKSVHQRIQSGVIEPLLTALQSRSNYPPNSKQQKSIDVDYSQLISHACIFDPAREGILEQDRLRAGILQQLFDVASQQETKDANRKRLYALWKAHTDDDENGKD